MAKQGADLPQLHGDTENAAVQTGQKICVFVLPWQITLGAFAVKKPQFAFQK
jgi:hypothetical protein